MDNINLWRYIHEHMNTMVTNGSMFRTTEHFSYTKGLMSLLLSDFEDVPCKVRFRPRPDPSDPGCHFLSPESMEAEAS